MGARPKISVISGHAMDRNEATTVMTRFCRRAFLLFAVGVSATGCVTTPEQTAQRNNDQCVARGYQPNTDAFADCMVRVESERDQRIESRRREALEKPAIPPLNRGY